MKALGAEIKAGINKKLAFNDSIAIEGDKLVIAGHSMGGWTAIFTSEGDQDLFKVCLAHDPMLCHVGEQIQKNELD